VERISSRQNAIVRRFRELARRGHADPGVLLDGAHLLQDALAAGIRVEAAAFDETVLDAGLAGLGQRASAAGARTFAVPPGVFSAMSPVRAPSGVVAIARLDPAPLDEVLRRSPQLVVILHDVQDPGNVGAAIRAAEGCGATGLITTGGSADPFGWKALRGAMGSAFRLPIATGIGFETCRRGLTPLGIGIVATVPRGGTPLPAADLRQPIALLLGGEGGGLSAELLQSADSLLTIPMVPEVESLNIAVAAGIILYEAARQRRIFEV
jgi:TrmH family RNA methyltransferase